jgi:hypothetical protein
LPAATRPCNAPTSYLASKCPARLSHCLCIELFLVAHCRTLDRKRSMARIEHDAFTPLRAVEIGVTGDRMIESRKSRFEVDEPTGSNANQR